ncbi:methyltransferase domain-containing protein [Actinopolymorpha pittospori]|uniref:SAM-dependent methyltransferase n=1 Tax=Actinopolymorpha pittospori TaxID=648752 RepID=A0A927MUU6_9ACTN|nr:SAM-dependent methyltransferase [Actinopolymorpha pittospori]
MTSRSASTSQERPFYAQYAWAYDHLIDDSPEPWAAAVHDRLVRAGFPRAAVLDAGCGTGRHAAALAARGHEVDLADASKELLRQAALRCPSARALHVDLCSFRPESLYQAVVCRGVLNDMTTDDERDAVLRAFAASLRAGGLVVLDVREEAGSRGRANGTPHRRTVDLHGRGRLTFTSTSTWNADLLLVREEYELDLDGEPSRQSTYEFAMRPWSGTELRQRLARAGFTDVEIAPGVGRRTDDRLFVTAARA